MLSSIQADLLDSSDVKLDSPLGTHLQYLVSMVANLTHEDSSDPIFIAAVGKDSMKHLLDSIKSILEAYVREEQHPQPSAAVSRLVMGALKSLVNITNNQEEGSSVSSGLLPCVFKIMTKSLKCKSGLDSSAAFDIVTLSLGVLINSCESSSECCSVLGECRVEGGSDAITYLISIFEENRTASASKAVETVDDDPDAHTDGCGKEEKEESPRETKVLESQAIASYSAMLLGFLAQTSKQIAKSIQSGLKSKDFSGVIDVLKDFIVLQCRANMLTKDSLKSLVQMVDFMKKCDAP